MKWGKCLEGIVYIRMFFISHLSFDFTLVIWNDVTEIRVLQKSDVKFIKLKKEETIIKKKVELPEIQKEVVVKKEIQKKVENNKKIDFEKSKELQKKNKKDG